MSDLLGGLLGQNVLGPSYGFNQADLANAQAGQLIRCHQAQQMTATQLQLQNDMLHHQALARQDQWRHDMSSPMVPEPSGTMKSVLEEMIARINALQDEVIRLRGERFEPQREQVENESKTPDLMVEPEQVETVSKTSTLQERIAHYRHKKQRS